MAKSHTARRNSSSCELCHCPLLKSHPVHSVEVRFASNCVIGGEPCGAENFPKRMGKLEILLINPLKFSVEERCSGQNVRFHGGMVIHQVIQKADVVITVDGGIDHVRQEFLIRFGREVSGCPPWELE